MYYIKEYHTTTNIYVNMIYFLALIQSVFICSSFMLRYIDYGSFLLFWKKTLVRCGIDGQCK